MRFPMAYPLTLNFRILAVASQLSVTDAQGSLVAYVKQKLFKLKEDVTVFENEQQTMPAFNMKADRVIDFSPRFQFVDNAGQTVGAVKRQGAKSLWRARYDVYDGAPTPKMQIREENAWAKVLDGLFGEIPIAGMFSGYIFHPAYLVTSSEGQPLLRMAKQPAFFEGKFLVEKMALLSPEDERIAFLSLMMTVLMERTRG